MITLRIHPAIGVARVGDSEAFYLGPETAGGLPTELDGQPIGPDGFRTPAGKVRRQAARFRVFRYDEAHPEGRPIDLDDPEVLSIVWTVHLANKKPSWYAFQTNLGAYGYLPGQALRNAQVQGEARHQLVIDPGPRTVEGRGAHAPLSRETMPQGYPGQFPPENLRPYSIDTLGDARTDAQGNLLVLGGHGRSGSTELPPRVTEYANNDGWFDDTSDGTIRCTVTLRTGEVLECEGGAWVLVGPPGYAPEIQNLVTLYDTMFDALVRNRGLRPDIFRDGMWQEDYAPSFVDDILPILERPGRYRWVVAIPPRPHRLPIERLSRPDPQWNALRQFYLDVLRSPGQPNDFISERGSVLMPYLAGDNILNPAYMSSNFLTLTPTQYFMMRQWVAGCFVPGPRPADAPGAALDRAVLENCVGGAFSPGIEMSWLSRDTRIFTAPFRVHQRALGPDQRLSLGLNTEAGMEPGDLTRQMAVPWQADFNECSAQPYNDRWVWWWPAQRPIWVRPESDPHLQVTWVGTAEDQNADSFTMFADDLEMVHKWKGLGFIVGVPGEQETHYVEVQRLLPYAPGSGAAGGEPSGGGGGERA